MKGGFKAVLWTDAFQFCMMIISIAIVIVKGSIDVGGPAAVYNASISSNRIEFFEYVSSRITWAFHANSNWLTNISGSIQIPHWGTAFGPWYLEDISCGLQSSESTKLLFSVTYQCRQKEMFQSQSIFLSISNQIPLVVEKNKKGKSLLILWLVYRALILCFTMIILMDAGIYYLGLVIYTKYKDCDPISAGVSLHLLLVNLT